MTVPWQEFLADRLADDRHYHHRHCVHNLSADEQRAQWRRKCRSDEEYEIVYGRAEPIVITPDDWEIDVPEIIFDGDADPVEGDN